METKEEGKGGQGRGRRRGVRGRGMEGGEEEGSKEGSPNYWGFRLICQSIIPQQLVTREIERMCVGWN